MLQVGDVLKNKFRVEKEIARGGMGAVYLAANEEFGTPVAIKEILENQASNPSARHGFLQEANFLLNLDHPNLPRVFEVFEEKNLLYVVMRYIAGKDLFERLAEGHKPDGTAEPLPLSDVLAIADTLLGALEYLHGLKSPVIHRDIKPSNLKIGPDGTLYLLDFGLAKTVKTVQPGYTPGFASYEQEIGQQTTTHSDLYSVGATLYSLLAGLYQLPTAQTRFAAQLRNDPDPLQPLDRLNPNVPRAICEVFEKAMALDPANRPASAKEMREMLKTAVLPNEVPTIPKPEDKKMTPLKLVNPAQDEAPDANAKRKEVVKLLGGFLPSQVKYLMTLMGMPSSEIPNGQGTTNADINAAFIEWAASTGRLDELKRELDEMAGKR